MERTLLFVINEEQIKKKIACSMIDFNFYYNDYIFMHFLSSLVTYIILCSYTRP